MNILFLGYWSLNDGLTQATIIPHLRILSSFENISQIVFCTIERNKSNSPNALVLKEFPKVIFIPLNSKESKIPLMDKLLDFTQFPEEISRLCRDYQIDRIVCRGAPTGGLGYLVSRKTKIPYQVESYEPHALYMLESGVWNKFDPRYLIQRYFERKQNKTAKYLMTVSHLYKMSLLKKGVDKNKIYVAPCAVDGNGFSFSLEKRKLLREKLNISMEAIAGVYLGKFGGIYLEKEAFQLFEECFQYYGERFYLILLCPQPKKEVEQLIRDFDIPLNKVFIKKVKHSEVPGYLSLSDFAFSLHKPLKSMIGISPIKNAEYWANGLPIIISENIGDDSKIIEETEFGIILKQDKSFKNSLKKMDDLLKSRTIKSLREEISLIAKKYRSFDTIKNIYEATLK